MERISHSGTQDTAAHGEGVVKEKAAPSPVVLVQGDCLDLLRQLPDNSVDLVFCSPPYEAQRTYGIGFNLQGQAWVDWAFTRYVECVRVCKGLVAWVVEGRTHKGCYSSTPILLHADLHRAGIKLRKSPIYKRHGTFGSGGREWLKNCWEPIICATKTGRLPWSDNTACGHPPKCPPGGNPSHRRKDGQRVSGRAYKPPKLANPGNVIDCGAVGGGNMGVGSRFAEQNEAPFPEQLATFFVKSFCPPGGIVLDPFNGSGTTVTMAATNGRCGIGFDLRQSQLDLTEQRLRTWFPVGPFKFWPNDLIDKINASIPNLPTTEPK